MDYLQHQIFHFLIRFKRSIYSHCSKTQYLRKNLQNKVMNKITLHPVKPKDDISGFLGLEYPTVLMPNHLLPYFPPMIFPKKTLDLRDF